MSSDGSAIMQAMQDEAGDNSIQRQFFADPEQLDLLRDDQGRLPADALRQLRAKRTGPGRPRNSRNKRNEKIAKWFIAKYGDPLDALGEIITTPPDVLYEQMILAQGGEAKGKRVTGLDVYQFIRQSALDVLPYIHGKQPIAVDVTGKADAVIFIPGLNAPAGFSKDELEGATRALGIDAIEQHGIRLEDGTLVTADHGSDGE